MADQGDIPDSSTAVGSGTDKAGVGGVRFAWAASRLIGVRATAGIGIADLFQGDEETKTSFYGAAAVGFNFANTTSVPIGLLGFYKWANFSTGASNIADGFSTFGLEVDYTGHKDFAMGLELSWIRIPQVDSDNEFSAVSAKINLRYFF